MPRIVLATLGSLGDLHPNIALGIELKRRGHDAVIASWEGYREKADALGLVSPHCGQISIRLTRN